MKKGRFLYKVILLVLVTVSIKQEAVGQTEEKSINTVELGRIVVVTPSRLEEPAQRSTQNVTVVGKEDIDYSKASEVSEILDLAPSVDMLEFGSLGATRSIHIRGTSSNQTLTLIDGRPINNPRDGVTDFNQISLSNIERIEILRGPGSSIYGANAVGGVINVITRKGTEEPKTELVTKFGSFSTKLTSLAHGYKINNFDYFISYEYLTSHGHRDNADYLSNNVNINLGYQLDKNHHLSVSSGYYNSEAGSPGLIYNVDLDDRLESFKKYVDITYKGTLSGNQSILLKLFHNIDRLEFIETFEPMDKNTHQTKVYGSDLQFTQNFSEFLRTTFGVSFQENRLNSSNSGKHTYNSKGIYFEAVPNLFDKIDLKLGARWDDYSNFGDRISPSASMNIWISKTLKIHALAAKSFRVPTFNDLYWPREDWGIWGGVEGNPHLGPEKAVSYEAGITGYFPKRFKVDLTLFKTSFKDLIEWSVDSAWWWKPENVSSASIKGAEIETQFDIIKNLSANFSYTYLEAKNKNTNKWLIYRPRHLYKIKLMYSPTSKYKVGVNAIYKTKRFANAGNTSFLKHYFVINLNFSYKINDFTDFIFEAKNILNRVYQEQRQYPMPTRAFYGGIKLTF